MITKIKELIAEYKRHQAIKAQLENLTDPTLIDRMYLDHQIDITISVIDQLTPKLRMIQDGLK